MNKYEDLTVRNRLAFALAAVLTAPIASANVVVIPANVPVCPPPSYTQKNIPHVNNLDLALRHGPTPAGDLASGKCGITEMRVAMGSCPAGAPSHFAYDIFDFETDVAVPDNRVFRQELQVNTLDGVPVGDRVKFSELRFSSNEVVSYYLERGTGSDDVGAVLVVTHRACNRRCPEEEISRMDFLTGLPPTLAVPVRISWSTGRSVSLTEPPSVHWSIGSGLQYNPAYRGSISLSMGARELTFSNGIVNGSCASNESTRIGFVKPRFGDD